jgi:hypothetical protein
MTRGAALEQWSASGGAATAAGGGAVARQRRQRRKKNRGERYGLICKIKSSRDLTVNQNFLLT